MRITLTWDDATPGTDGTIVRWDFGGFIGLVDYIVPMNETAQKAIFADSDIDAILNMGWTMPFPNRPMLHLYHAILAAPPALRSVVIASANPLTRGIIRWRLLNRYPDLAARLHLVRSLDTARTLIADLRAERR